MSHAIYALTEAMLASPELTTIVWIVEAKTSTLELQIERRATARKHVMSDMVERERSLFRLTFTTDHKVKYLLL